MHSCLLLKLMHNTFRVRDGDNDFESKLELRKSSSLYLDLKAERLSSLYFSILSRVRGSDTSTKGKIEGGNVAFLDILF